MKTLLSVNITESQKGEFPDLGINQFGSFPSVPDFTDFTSLSSASGATIRRMLSLLSEALLAASCDCQ
jgi:hypothetical protein